MAKVLLACDEYIYENSGKYYAPNQEWLDFYKRYLRVFDTLRLATRCKHESHLMPKRVPLDDEPRIEFVPMPFFQGPKGYAKVYFAYSMILNNILDGCDAAILRLPWTLSPRIYAKIRKAAIPYACEVVYDAEDAWKNAKGLERILWKRIDKDMRLICSHADGVSCVTEHYLQKHYYSLKEGSFVSNYSSLALPASFYGSPRKFPAKQQFIISHIANQVEYNGRKGHNELIAALCDLKKKGIDAKVRFAGKDYFGGTEELTALAGQLGVDDRVEFVGFLDRKELSLFLDEADIYVMPTRAEGLPRVLIEAMSKALPCITTPVSGNPELIDEHFLVPYENVSLLADRIVELMTDATLYERTSRENLERSRKYEASVLQEKRDAFYGKLKERILLK